MRKSDRSQLAWLAALIVGLHVVGWGGVWWAAGRGAPALAGLAGLSYAFGLRHAFDPDHIAAIDNTARKLLSQSRQPLSVGFFFSAGHSTVVLLMTLAIAVATDTVTREMPRLQAVGSRLGTAVSGVFLFLIGLMNLVVLTGIVRSLRAGRAGTRQAGDELVASGALTRWFGGVFRLVSQPWHLYPVGFLFGLGFDTASEIGLLTTAAIAASQAMPVWAVLSLPVVFAAGMTLFDTVNGIVMCRAYGWASANPAGRAFYNLAMTGISAAVAFVLGARALWQGFFRAG